MFGGVRGGVELWISYEHPQPDLVHLLCQQTATHRRGRRPVQLAGAAAAALRSRRRLR